MICMLDLVTSILLNITYGIDTYDLNFKFSSRTPKGWSSNFTGADPSALYKHDFIMNVHFLIFFEKECIRIASLQMKPQPVPEARMLISFLK
jgi:hypothetical protein